MKTIYGTVISAMLRMCSKYRSGGVSLDELKGAVWQAAQQIESSDEVDLRNSLQAIEGRLDMIQFTTDSDDVFEATIPVVREIEELASKVS